MLACLPGSTSSAITLTFFPLVQVGSSWNSNLFSIHAHCISIKMTIRKKARGINKYDLVSRLSGKACRPQRRSIAITTETNNLINIVCHAK